MTKPMQPWQNKLQEDSSWGSHLPVIVRVLEATQGPILELGMGQFSTPLLDLMCHETKRLLVSYDDDSEWFAQNQEWGQSDYHRVNLITSYAEAEIEKTHWSVALIDHKPAERRVVEIQRLANKADYLIVHDTEAAWEKDFGFHSIFPIFRYRHDYTLCRPQTSILSNFFDPEKLFA